MSQRLTCCVCGGRHHPVHCLIAQRYIAECLEPISPPPRRRRRRVDSPEIWK